MGQLREGLHPLDRARGSALRALLAVGLVAAGTVVGASTAAAAGSGAITVTPQTGLVDGQTVTVSGSGWVPGHVIGFCEGIKQTPAGINDCDGGVPKQVVADGTGHFTQSLVIKRHIVAGQGANIDCAGLGAPGPCFVGAADNDDINTIVYQSLAFAPVPPIPTVLPAGGIVVEGNSGTTDLHVSVTLSNPSSQTITVQWTTVFAPRAPAGQADPATDYTPTSGTATFAPGQTTQSVTITVNGDTLVEPDEYIIVSFRNPTNAHMGGFWGLGFGLITNDD